MTWLEHKIPPPLITLIIAGLMWASTSFVPTYEFEETIRVFIALILAACGITIAIAGVQHFRRADTTVNPLKIDAATSLVTGGIFAYTRNPMYLGMALVLIAWAIFLSSPLLLLGPLIFVLVMERLQIRPEERILLAKFGSSYEDYTRRVRRWI